MKIFIAGCGRSGTTMFRAQMRGLPDSHVVATEERFSHFSELETTASYVVIKRDSDTCHRLHKLPDDVRLIYMVRHPYDLLTSHHPGAAKQRRFHITPERWTNEYAGLRRLEGAQPKRSIFFLRYEDVVTRSEEVQQRLSHWLGTDFKLPFGTVRRIVPNSLYKWRMYPDRVDYLAALPKELRAEIAQFCDRFDYNGTLSLSRMHRLLRAQRFVRQRFLTRQSDTQWGES